MYGRVMRAVRNTRRPQKRMLSANASGLASYSTSFPLTENPITEGGRWRSTQDPNQTAVRTTTGEAFGTNVAAAGLFDDSHAFLTAFVGAVRIRAVVFKGAGTNQSYEEIELLGNFRDDYATRSTIYGDTTSNGYEWNVAWNGAYQNVGRWKGAALDSTAPDFTPANGDIMEMLIQPVAGNVSIQCLWNSVLKINVTDSDPLKITSGWPGIGFFISNSGGGTPTNSNFGFSQITVSML